MPNVFHEVRLPEQVEQGAQFGPGFNTTVHELSSGFEQRNQNWSNSRARGDIGYGIMDKDDFSEVLTFFYCRRAKAFGFRFKDWTDFEMERDTIGTGDGADATWQIKKTYSDSANSYERNLYKIVSGTLSVWVNNVLQTLTTHYTVNMDTGLITFTGGYIPANGHLIEVECEFDVPVRFDQDDMMVAAKTFRAGSIPNIKIIELRGDGT